MHGKGDATLTVVLKPRIHFEVISVAVVGDNWTSAAVSPIENEVIRTVAAWDLNEVIWKRSTELSICLTLFQKLSILEHVVGIGVEKALIGNVPFMQVEEQADKNEERGLLALRRAMNDIFGVDD